MSDQPTPKNVIVVGAGYAGVLAANRLAGKLTDARVLLVSPTDQLVDRIRLHEAAARGRNVEHPLRSLLHARVAHLPARLTALDPVQDTITVARDGETQRLAYDALVLAMGSTFSQPLQTRSAHALALSTPERARALYHALRALPQGTVSVAGGGLTAIELAAEIAEAHPRLQVQLVTSELAAPLHGPAQTALRSALQRAGVRLVEGQRVAALHEHTIELVDGTHLPSDVSVLASGFVPGAPAAQLGLPAAPDGRIAVDESLRVLGLSKVFAAGDIAAPPAHCIGHARQTTRMGCASAMPMGAHAADQVLRLLRGRALLPYRFHYLLQCISVGRRQGVIAFVDADDQPSGRLLSGLRGALTKEIVCRFVMASLRLERLFAGLYAWPGKRSAALALPSPTPKHLPQ